MIRMDGHATFQNAVKRLTEVDASTPSRAPALELDDIDLFVYHQANGRIITRRRRAARPRRRSASPTTSPSIGNTSAASIPLALALRARGRPAAPRRHACCWPRSAPASPGAPASWSGATAHERPPRQRHRARHRRLQGHRRRDRAARWPTTAGPSRVNYRSDEAGASATVDGDRGRRRHAPSPSTATSPTRRRRRRCSTPLEERARPRARAGQQRRRAPPTASRSSSSDETWDRVIDTNLTAAFRLTRRALRADDPRPLRPRSSTSPRSSARAPTPARPTTPPPRPA